MGAPTETGQVTVLRDLEEVIAWAHRHDAQVAAWWAMQFRENDKVSTRLDSLEGKVMRWAGAGSLVGILIGGGVLGLMFL